MIYKEAFPSCSQSELGCAATSETAAKCEGESAAGGGNQPEPSIGRFLPTVGETPALPATDCTAHLMQLREPAAFC